MDELLPSEIARLVLGYIEEDSDCGDDLGKRFLESSPNLRECLEVSRRGGRVKTRVEGYNLLSILHEYCAIHQFIAAQSRHLSGDTLREFRFREGAVEKLKYLFEHSQLLRSHSLAENVTPTTLRQPLNGVEHLSVQVHSNTSPLHSSENLANHSSHSSRSDSAHGFYLAPSPTIAVSQPLDSVASTKSADSNIARSGTPVPNGDKLEENETSGSGLTLERQSNQKEVTDINSSAANVVGSEKRDVTFETPSKKQGPQDGQDPSLSSPSATPSTKRKCPNSAIKRKVTSGVGGALMKTTSKTKLKTGSDDGDSNCSIDFSMLQQAFLDNTEIHHLIAENINAALYNHEPIIESRGPNDVEAPLSEGSEPEIPYELRQAIKTVVDKTERDPLFEKILDEIIGPFDESANESHEEFTAEKVELSVNKTTARKVQSSVQEVARKPDIENSENEVPLKRRLRSAQKKDVEKSPCVKTATCTEVTLEDQNNAAIEFIVCAGSSTVGESLHLREVASSSSARKRNPVSDTTMVVSPNVGVPNKCHSFGNKPDQTIGKSRNVLESAVSMAALDESDYTIEEDPLELPSHGSNQVANFVSVSSVVQAHFPVVNSIITTVSGRTHVLPQVTYCNAVQPSVGDMSRVQVIFDESVAMRNNVAMASNLSLANTVVPVKMTINPNTLTPLQQPTNVNTDSYFCKASRVTIMKPPSQMEIVSMPILLSSTPPTAPILQSNLNPSVVSCATPSSGYAKIVPRLLPQSQELRKLVPEVRRRDRRKEEERRRELERRLKAEKDKEVAENAAIARLRALTEEMMGSQVASPAPQRGYSATSTITVCKTSNDSFLSTPKLKTELLQALSLKSATNALPENKIVITVPGRCDDACVALSNSKNDAAAILSMGSAIEIESVAMFSNTDEAFSCTDSDAHVNTKISPGLPFIDTPVKDGVSSTLKRSSVPSTVHVATTRSDGQTKSDIKSKQNSKPSISKHSLRKTKLITSEVSRCVDIVNSEGTPCSEVKDEVSGSKQTQSETNNQNVPVSTNQVEDTNNTKVSSCSIDRPKTTSTGSSKGKKQTPNQVKNSIKRISSSTPRRSRSHIRALDFTTPPKQHSSPFRRSATSPKNFYNKRSPRSALKFGGKIVFKSPLAKRVRSSLFHSPSSSQQQKASSTQLPHVKEEVETSKSFEMSNEEFSHGVAQHHQTETTQIEVSKIVNSEQLTQNAESKPVPQMNWMLMRLDTPVKAPIATRTPSTPLSGDWDRVTGVGLIFGDSSSKVETPSVASELAPKTPTTPFSNSWDAKLRALLPATPDPPHFPKCVKKVAPTDKKASKKAASESSSEGDKSKSKENVSADSKQEKKRRSNKSSKKSKDTSMSPSQNSRSGKSSALTVESKLKEDIKKKVIQSPTNLKAAKRNLVSQTQTSSPSLQDSDLLTQDNFTVSVSIQEKTVTSRSIMKDLNKEKVTTATVGFTTSTPLITRKDQTVLKGVLKEVPNLLTPLKEDSNLVPMTPRLLSPKDGDSDTPLTKLIRGDALFDCSMIPTPFFSVTPGINTPSVKSTSSYVSTPMTPLSFQSASQTPSYFEPKSEIEWKSKASMSEVQDKSESTLKAGAENTCMLGNDNAKELERVQNNAEECSDEAIHSSSISSDSKTTTSESSSESKSSNDTSMENTSDKEMGKSKTETKAVESMINNKTCSEKTDTPKIKNVIQHKAACSKNRGVLKKTREVKRKTPQKRLRKVSFDKTRDTLIQECLRNMRKSVFGKRSREKRLRTRTDSSSSISSNVSSTCSCSGESSVESEASPHSNGPLIRFKGKTRSKSSSESPQKQSNPISGTQNAPKPSLSAEAETESLSSAPSVKRKSLNLLTSLPGHSNETETTDSKGTDSPVSALGAVKKDSPVKNIPIRKAKVRTSKTFQPEANELEAKRLRMMNKLKEGPSSTYKPKGVQKKANVSNLKRKRASSPKVTKVPVKGNTDPNPNRSEVTNVLIARLTPRKNLISPRKPLKVIADELLKKRESTLIDGVKKVEIPKEINALDEKASEMSITEGTQEIAKPPDVRAQHSSTEKDRVGCAQETKEPPPSSDAKEINSGIDVGKSTSDTEHGKITETITTATESPKAEKSTRDKTSERSSTSSNKTKRSTRSQQSKSKSGKTSKGDFDVEAHSHSGEKSLKLRNIEELTCNDKLKHEKLKDESHSLMPKDMSHDNETELKPKPLHDNMVKQDSVQADVKVGIVENEIHAECESNMDEKVELIEKLENEDVSSLNKTTLENASLMDDTSFCSREDSAEHMCFTPNGIHEEPNVKSFNRSEREGFYNFTYKGDGVSKQIPHENLPKFTSVNIELEDGQKIMLECKVSDFKILFSVLSTDVTEHSNVLKLIDESNKSQTIDVSKKSEIVDGLQKLEMAIESRHKECSTKKSSPRKSLGLRKKYSPIKKSRLHSKAICHDPYEKLRKERIDSDWQLKARRSWSRSMSNERELTTKSKQHKSPLPLQERPQSSKDRSCTHSRDQHHSETSLRKHHSPPRRLDSEHSAPSNSMNRGRSDERHHPRKKKESGPSHSQAEAAKLTGKQSDKNNSKANYSSPLDNLYAPESGSQNRFKKLPKSRSSKAQNERYRTEKKEPSQSNDPKCRESIEEIKKIEDCRIDRSKHNTDSDGRLPGGKNEEDIVSRQQQLEPSQGVGSTPPVDDDDLMTYALVGSVREETDESDCSAFNTAKSRGVETRGNNPLPLKKRKASVGEPSKQSSKRTRLEDPQALLKRVDLDRFLSALHGED